MGDFFRVGEVTPDRAGLDHHIGRFLCSFRRCNGRLGSKSSQAWHHSAGHRFAGRRCGGVEPISRAGLRRADEPYIGSATTKWGRWGGGGVAHGWGVLGAWPIIVVSMGEFTGGGAGGGYAGDVSVCVHATETEVGVEHDHRGDPWCASAIDGMGGCPRAGRSARLDAVWNPVFLAGASLHGDRLALQGGLRQGRVCHVAQCRRGRGADRAAGGQSLGVFDDREPDAIHFETRRHGVFGGGRVAGAVVSVGCSDFFEEFEPAKCPVPVFCLHHLSPSIAGVDGGG